MSGKLLVALGTFLCSTWLCMAETAFLTGDERTDDIQKRIEGEQLAQESAEPDGWIAPAPETPERIGSLPRARIKADGSLDDWTGVPPLLSGAGIPGNQHLDKVYLASNAERLCFRLDVNDSRSGLSLRSDNLDHGFSYGIDLRSGERHVLIRVYRGTVWTVESTRRRDVDKATPGWVLEALFTDSQGRLTVIGGAAGAVAVRGSSAEASLDMATILRALELPAAGAPCDVSALSGIFRGVHEAQRKGAPKVIDADWSWDTASGDRTGWTQLILAPSAVDEESAVVSTGLNLPSKQAMDVLCCLAGGAGAAASAAYAIAGGVLQVVVAFFQIMSACR